MNNLRLLLILSASRIVANSLDVRPAQRCASSAIARSNCGVLP